MTPAVCFSIAGAAAVLALIAIRQAHSENYGVIATEILLALAPSHMIPAAALFAAVKSNS